MKKNMIIVGLLVLAVVFVVNMKNRKQSGVCSVGVAPGGGCAFPTTENDSAKQKALPRLLDLGADKCTPCKMMTPILDEMKTSFKGQLVVEFIDVWKDQAMAKKYEIQSIPTQIFFDAKGKELFRHQGFFPRADMMKKWAELGYHFNEPKK